MLKMSLKVVASAVLLAITASAQAHVPTHNRKLHLPVINRSVKYGAIYHSYPQGANPTGSEVAGPIYQNGQDVTLSLSTIVGSTPVAPAFANTIARNASTRLADTVNVQDFGATCNGSTDDTIAFEMAVSVGAAQGKSVVFQGTCVVNGTITTQLATPAGFSLDGRGGVLLTHGNSLFSLTTTASSQPISMRNFTVTNTSAVQSGQAIYVNSAQNSGAGQNDVFENLNFNNMLGGIRLSATSNAQISNINMQMAGSNAAQAIGIELDGPTVSGTTYAETNTSIVNVYEVGGQALYLNGSVQGVDVSHLRLIQGSTWGIQEANGVAVGNINIHDSHVESALGGVWIPDDQSVQISNNLFDSTVPTRSSTWRAIALGYLGSSVGTLNNVSHNRVQDFGQTTVPPIYVRGGQNTIEGNVLDGVAANDQYCMTLDTTNGGETGEPYVILGNNVCWRAGGFQVTGVTGNVGNIMAWNNVYTGSNNTPVTYATTQTYMPTSLLYADQIASNSTGSVSISSPTNLTSTLSLGGALTALNGGTLSGMTITGGNVNGAVMNTSTTTVGTQGSVARSFAARLADTVNVKDYGAAGNGHTDDTAAFQAAFAAAIAANATGPVRVDIPPGRYMISSAWKPAFSVSNSFGIVGAGESMTTVVFANSDGFDITGTQTTGNLDVTVSSLRMLTGNTSSTFANTGITITSPFVPGEEVHPIISHVLMTDVSLKQQYGWNVGVNLNTTVNANLDDLVVQLPPYNGSTQGVQVQIQGNINVSGDFSISTHIHHSTLTGGYAGVLVGSYVQTVDVGNSVIIGNNFGIHWDGSATGDFAENLQSTANNFNALTDDIWLSHVNESQIQGNMLLQYGNVANWAGIYIESSGWETITGNTVVALPQTAPFNSTNGFVIDNSSGSSAAISGNIITGLHGVCIVMSGTTSMVSSSGNTCNGPYVTSPYSETNQGTNMLGPVSFNSQPAPTRYDGYHFDLIGTMPIVSANGAASYLTNDGSSGARLVSVSGSSGQFTADGNLVSGTGNILPGPGMAFITRDNNGTNGAMENVGFVAPDGAYGLNFGTLKANATPEAGTTPYVVAGLPACNSATWGHTASVNDATVTDTSANYGTVVAGGGKNGAFVRCVPNATSWTIY